MERLAILGLALAAYYGSLAIGGNGFIAAFVGGIVFRFATRNQFVEPTEFTEAFGSFLSLLVWTVFGAVLVTAVFQHAFDWRPLVYALLSLTVVRMAPVALAMVGAGLRRDTILLMGWFRPAGWPRWSSPCWPWRASRPSAAPWTPWWLRPPGQSSSSVVAHGFVCHAALGLVRPPVGSSQGITSELAELPELHQRHVRLDGLTENAEKIIAKFRSNFSPPAVRERGRKINPGALGGAVRRPKPQMSKFLPAGGARKACKQSF